ncbi:MAG: beta-glucosidase [Cyanobacteriota bacterium]
MPSPESKARKLLAQLSLEEKLSLLEGATPFWSGMADIAWRDASHRHPWPTTAIPRLGLNGLKFVDGPRGVVLEGGATTFPVPIARGATWNVELEERIGEAMAREARSFGADWLAAVCVNVLRHPGWGRAQETYGEDPLHLAAMGSALTRGISRHAVACVKHFALNSIDSSRFLVDVRVTPRALQEIYLPHFRACIEAGAGSVMGAYNRVNGEWCSQHRQLLHSILKQRWGFRGFVVSDFIFGVRDGVEALSAGLDLEMPFRMVFAGCLGEALAQGRLPIERLDDAVLRQLRVQLAVPKGEYPTSLRNCRAHRELARQAASQSIVLLRNEGASLPLLGLHNLALIGPLATTANLGDRGSSDTRPSPGSVVTVLDGLRTAAPHLDLRLAGGEPQAAAALAASCEAAVVVAGLSWREEGEHIHPGDIAPVLRLMPPPAALQQHLEWRRLKPTWRRITELIAAVTRYGSARAGGDFAAGDRIELSLDPRLEALIEAVAAANPRTVVVLMGGGAILSESWRRKVPALLHLWYPGQEGGAALAEVLLGRVSPSGRLPYALPRSADHLPCFEPRAAEVDYDLWHGYRLLQREGHRSAFPFGYGLSYTSFAYEDLTLLLQEGEGGMPQLELGLTVRNTGAMAAGHVVQIYGDPPGVEVERAPRLLVGFARLELEAGSARRLQLTLPLRRLAFFSEREDAFVVEAGVHRLAAALHVEDPGLGAELLLERWVLGP